VKGRTKDDIDREKEGRDEREREMRERDER
jgi:hypothetical protein